MKGIMKRPKAVVLPENAVVPNQNLISPPPNQFSHFLKRAQPYYFVEVKQGTPPDGEFSAGTKVLLLLYEGGKYCRVADNQGLYVEVEYDSLKKL
jgi:hypothetical protein